MSAHTPGPWVAKSEGIMDKAYEGHVSVPVIRLCRCGRTINIHKRSTFMLDDGAFICIKCGHAAMDQYAKAKGESK